jgi:hypothetical protein
LQNGAVEPKSPVIVAETVSLASQVSFLDSHSDCVTLVLPVE